ncbi:TRIC cation channel family protein [Mariniluteicoccus flavus]
MFRALDLLGVVLNGIIGGTLARQRRFDAVGFAVLAIVSALGGGMLRDTLLQAGRPVALVDPWYLICALAGAAIAFVMNVRRRPWEVAYPIADAVVLGAWAAAGTTKSLAAGLDWLPAMLLGIITAVGGGMIRDIAVGEVPEVFGGNTLYAVPALIAAGVIVVGDAVGGNPGAVMLGATVAGASLALIARRRGWQLPVHGDGTVTMTRDQLARLIRRVERRTQRSRDRGGDAGQAG